MSVTQLHPDPGSLGDFGDLDVVATLAAAGAVTAEQHAAQVRALGLGLHFAALHSGEPVPASPGGELAGTRLVQLGGDGTPWVQDLPICELAVARQVHEYAARNEVADALDLAFRLPRTWAGLQAGRGRVWVGQRVARMSRHLDRRQVRGVDAAIAAALDQAPGRLLSIAEAAVDRADPEHARRQVEERQRRRCLVIGRSDEDGLRRIFGRIDAGEAAWIDAMVERIADALERRPDLLPAIDDAGESRCSRDELRAEAFGWLAHPDDVIALLNGTHPVQGEPDPSHEQPARRRPSRQSAVVYVHLSQAAIEAYLAGSCADVVGRVEGLGPMLAEQLRRLLGHARIEARPVIDLNEGRSVNQYEFPADVKERVHLRTCGEVFPHAQNQSRRLDGDHTKPYDGDGADGQTGDHNLAPLGRRGHRAKTHLPYQVTQIGLNAYVWRTPHGLYRLVDGSGTQLIDQRTAEQLVEGARDGRDPP